MQQKPILTSDPAPFALGAPRPTLEALWRPAMMICVIVILFVNYALLPLLKTFLPGAQPIVFPDAFWQVVAIIVGIYVTGRSAEKIVRTMHDGTSSE